MARALRSPRQGYLALVGKVIYFLFSRKEKWGVNGRMRAKGDGVWGQAGKSIRIGLAMVTFFPLVCGLWVLAGEAVPGPTAVPVSPSGQGRVNHEGRPLPLLPKFALPVLFNTVEADRILEAMQVFPADNPWNQDISKLPVHPFSGRMIQKMNPQRPLGFNLDMGFVLVPPDQARIGVKLTDYPDESDPGPYPVPENAPVEGWPLCGTSLEKIQREGSGDRHIIVVDPWNGKLFEFFTARRTGAGWEAGCAAIFDLNSNRLRPSSWTSADAAGLPIFPAVVRYDECERGKVEHALRVTFRKTRRAFIPPATHFASKDADPELPAMGQRLRLKASVDASSFPKHAQAVVWAMKRYGLLVADNGMDWLISVAPDARILGLEALRRLRGSDFEVVQTDKK